MSPPPPDAGVVDAAPPDAAAPDAGSPPIETVTTQTFEANRISGNKNIVPDDATKEAITAAGKTKLVIPFKLCVDAQGIVFSVRVLKPSDFPAYDAKLEAELWTWTYEPFLINGSATPVCSALTFIYVQKT